MTLGLKICLLAFLLGAALLLIGSIGLFLIYKLGLSEIAFNIFYIITIVSLLIVAISFLIIAIVGTIKNIKGD